MRKSSWVYGYQVEFWSARHTIHEPMGRKKGPTNHPQTDGQKERTNQIWEDMLRLCALKYGKNWDKCLPTQNSLKHCMTDLSGGVPGGSIAARQCGTAGHWSWGREWEELVRWATLAPGTTSEATRAEVWQGEDGDCRNRKWDMTACGSGRVIHRMHDGSCVNPLR
jgi:hypothetical protein